MTQVRKAVIPVAGYGTRMYPASRALKKELFPVVDRTGIAKPVIQVIIEEAVDSGIEEVCLVSQPADEALFRHYFDADLPPDLEARVHAREWARNETARLHDLSKRIAYVPQLRMEGFGHAVYCCREWVGDEPFLLLLGDHLYRSSTDERCAAQLLRVFERMGGTAVAVGRADESQLALCGTVGGTVSTDDPSVIEISEFHEKPDVDYARAHLRFEGGSDGDYLCFLGQYALSPDVFDVLGHLVEHDIRERGEIQFTAALELLRRSRGRSYAYETRGRRFDTGIPSEYVRTLADFGSGE